MPLRSLVVLILLTFPAHGQNSRVFSLDQAVYPGQTVIASLSLASTPQPVAALQFDLQWDPAISLQFIPGDQMRAASKIPHFTAVTPQTLRCLISGINQTAIPDGELLRMIISVDPNSLPGSAQVKITNVLASDPFGIVVSVGASPFNIQIPSGTTPLVLPNNAVVNAASLAPGPLSPGEIITLFGLYGAQSISLQIGGVTAPVLYAGMNQINAVVPFGLDLTSPARLQLLGPHQTLTMTLPVALASPAIFTSNGSGLGSGAILNEDYTINSFDNPARPGSSIMVYGAGFGPLKAPVVDGQLVASANPSASPVTARVGGIPAEVLYAGSAPQLVAGVTQINVQLPVGIVHNLSAPLILTMAGASTAPGITVAIQ